MTQQSTTHRWRTRVDGLARTARWSPFRRDAFGTVVHHPRMATVVGRLLGLSVTVCFCTGLYSHFLQEPAGWMVFPTSPVWLYRVSQGLHVATGTAAIPLLLAKLWIVYPRLFTWPPLRNARHLAERASIAVLVAATTLQLFMGFINTLKWYPWPFSFRTVHFWLAWVIVGALLVHVAVKLPTIVQHWRGRSEATPAPSGGWSRRGFLGTVAAGVGVVTATTVGQTVTPLGDAALLAPRRPGIGPQGLPVNRTAAEAGIPALTADDWRLDITGPRSLALTLSDLEAMRQVDAELPISCVEGWSQSARWRGVPIADLMELMEAPAGASLHVVSAQTRASYDTSVITPEFARHPRTLLALRLNGDTLHIDHGFPARVISPARPGVLQTKWVRGMEVLG